MLKMLPCHHTIKEQIQKLQSDSFLEIYSKRYKQRETKKARNNFLF